MSSRDYWLSYFLDTTPVFKLLIRQTYVTLAFPPCPHQFQRTGILQRRVRDYSRKGDQATQPSQRWDCRNDEGKSNQIKLSKFTIDISCQVYAPVKNSPKTMGRPETFGEDRLTNQHGLSRKVTQLSARLWSCFDVFLESTYSNQSSIVSSAYSSIILTCTSVGCFFNIYLAVNIDFITQAIDLTMKRPLKRPYVYSLESRTPTDCSRTRCKPFTILSRPDMFVM